MKRYTTYKDSGVKWIGEIPSHWETKRLSQVASEYFVSNKTIHHQNLLSLSYGNIVRKDINTTDGLLPATFDNYQVVDDGIIVLRLTDLQNDHKSLRVGLAHEQGIVTSAYLSLKPKGTISNEYLYEQLHSNDIHKVFYGMGDGLRQSLNWQGIKTLGIVLPPLAEQRAIVSFLDKELGKIDTYMEKEQQLIDRLKELKQSVIARAVTRGINPDAKMKPSGINWIGDIPEHWEVKRLGSFFVENRKLNTDLKYTEAYKFNYGSLVRKDENVDLSLVEETYRKYTMLNENDIVINGLNLNYDFVSQRVAQSYNKGIITSAYLVITPREGVNNIYFCYLLKAMDNMKLFHGMGTGIRLTLSFSDLKSQLLPIPPIAEQQAIVDYITTATAKIDKLIVEKTYELEYMKELRQRIISDAVTGKIDVRGFVTC